VAGGWARLHNEELRNLYASPNVIWVIKSMSMIWAEHVAGMKARMNWYNVLVGKLEGKTPLEIPMCR
jgi:hypothetical protein